MSLERMSLELKSINTIRTLAMDGVQKANSGHPGTPMALAPLAYHLFCEVMQHNPQDPSWPNRDRFVLSCGHASMLLYAMLHLTGYGLTLEDLKSFRQWGSLTPGHPEVHHTAGVEITTGPLGQGLASAVGMALAEAHLAATSGEGSPIDHYTYVICSDGDLMEGVTAEACSLAGHWGLGKLIAYWDDNKITIDGTTDISFTEDVGRRFEAYGWHVLRVEDINDLDALRAATQAAQAETSRPTLVMVRSIIGYGSPNKANTPDAHGSPLGAAEIALTKAQLGWPEDASFLVPDDVAAHMGGCVARGAAAQAAWTTRFASWAASHPEASQALHRRFAGELPEGWDEDLPSFTPESGKIATRKSSEKALKTLLHRLPELLGGSADLAGSNGTEIEEFGIFGAGAYDGRMIPFGIREHGMGSITSGMILHGGLRAFCATFLVFSDYMRGSMRLASLMQVPTIYIMTHDSIGLGEDGPTHQPVEHLAALRVIPNLHVFRPGDANESVEAWRCALRRTDGPTVLVLTRQGLAVHDRARFAPASGAQRGGYILAEGDGYGEALIEPEVILVATGSELELAMAASAVLHQKGRRVRVVSMPCKEIFLAQEEAYRHHVLPPNVRKRVVIEAATPFGWGDIATDEGAVIGIDTFGASAPGPELMRRFGFSVENVVATAERLLTPPAP